VGEQLKPIDSEDMLPKLKLIPQKIEKEIYWLLILPLSVLFSELFLKYLIYQPLNSFHISFPWVFNFLLLFSIFSFFILLIGRLKFAIVLSASIYLLVSLAHGLKLRFLGSPLFLSDFHIAGLRTALKVLPSLRYFELIVISLVVFILISTLLYLIYKKEVNPIKKQRLNLKKRIFLFLICNIIPILFIFGTDELEIIISNSFSFRKLDRNNQELYQTQGLLAGLLLNAKGMVKKDRPENYNLNLITDLVKAHDINNSQNTSKRLLVKPNIVLILAETFWDPLAYPALKVTPDPIPFFRSMQKKKGGKVFVPVAGGGTVITEFEILTGFSTQFIWGFPYTSGIFHPIPSLASIYKENGYNTSFIHGYHGWFYDRERVLPLLGFDQFIYDKHIQAEFAGQEIEDFRYIKDSYFFQVLQNRSNQTSPYFIFASNYATHGPFDYEKIESNFQVSAELNQKQKENLIGNLQLLKAFDMELKKFIEFTSKKKEPTLVFVFGDHVPTEAYLGFPLKQFAISNEEIFQCPYFLWANYEVKDFPDPISVNYIPIYILKNSISNLPIHFEIIESLRKEVPVFSYYKKANNTRMTKNLSEDYNQWIYHYRLLQYDLMYGNQYLCKMNTVQF
jgi:phosphoglycerol transferase MdoB-like AlkP superfamily enzyme